MFKYYIHDSVDACRLQLLGSLSEAYVRELNGCWNTAKTTLGGRKLVIDLRGLQSTDEAGKAWLLSMVHEGATYLPESYFRAGLSGEAPEPPRSDGRKIGLWAKLFSTPTT